MRRRVAAANGDVYTLAELIVPSLAITVSFQYNSINQVFMSVMMIILLMMILDYNP